MPSSWKPIPLITENRHEAETRDDLLVESRQTEQDLHIHIVDAGAITGPSTTPQASPRTFLQDQKTTLFSLPLELRQEIYRYIICNDGLLSCFLGENYFNRRRPWDNRTALLCVSKQISEEALDILYHNTKFQLDLVNDKREEALQIVPQRHRKKIRRLGVRMIPGAEIVLKTQFDSELWNSIMSNLIWLCIVAADPCVRADPEKQIPEEEMEAWRRWAGSIFAYVDENLAKDVVIQIDDDDRDETGRLIAQNVVRHNVKRVLTEVGDWVFIRRGAKEFVENDRCCVM